MSIEADWRFRLGVGVVVTAILAGLALFCLGGCGESVENLKASSSAVTAEAVSAGAALADLATEIEALRLEVAELEIGTPGRANAENALGGLLAVYERNAGTLGGLVTRAEAVNADRQDAETEREFWLTAATAAVGAIPGFGVALPFINLFRRRFRETVGVISMSGGPKSPDMIWPR